ncbi:MAG: hypothetical protein AAF432_02160 [Planctomycetota bacterium]
MRKPGTDENNVQMSDVLCDFCHREWTEDIAMVEGHHGACMCERCLLLAYTELVLNRGTPVVDDFTCPLCREGRDDRAAMDRHEEPGWPSPLYPDVVACRRCIKRASGVLHKDPDFDWAKPRPATGD